MPVFLFRISLLLPLSAGFGPGESTFAILLGRYLLHVFLSKRTGKCFREIFRASTLHKSRNLNTLKKKFSVIELIQRSLVFASLRKLFFSRPITMVMEDTQQPSGTQGRLWS